MTNPYFGAAAFATCFFQLVQFLGFMPLGTQSYVITSHNPEWSSTSWWVRTAEWRRRPHPQRHGDPRQHVVVILLPHLLAAAHHKLARHVRLGGQRFAEASRHQVLDPGRGAGPDTASSYRVTSASSSTVVGDNSMGSGEKNPSDHSRDGYTTSKQ